ncbi:MAG: hypothetical protein AABX31_01580 [Nanoarchaeota archaeon]
MRKIFVISSLLVMFLFLVACVPQKPLTDEELKAELSKLTPEEREALLKDLESKEGGAFAGQAIRSRYSKISPKAAGRFAITPKTQVRSVIENLRRVEKQGKLTQVLNQTAVNKTIPLPVNQTNSSMAKPMNITNTTSYVNVTNNSVPQAGNVSKPMNDTNVSISMNSSMVGVNTSNNSRS